MKRGYVVYFLIGFLLVLSGCQGNLIEVPDSPEKQLFITHAKEPTLSFLNPNTNEMLSSTSVPYPLIDIAFISETSLIGLNQYEDYLVEVDLTKQVARPYLELGTGMTALVYDDITDRLYVTDSNENILRVIQAESAEEIASISLGVTPNEIVLDQKNEQLYIMSSNESEIVVIDQMSHQISNTISTEDAPAGIFANSGELWVGGHGANVDLNTFIYAYDPQSGEQLKKIEVGLMPIAIEGTQNELFVLCHGDHTLYKINTETNEVEMKAEVGQNPNDVYALEDKLYVTNLDSDTVSILSKSDLSLIATIPVASGPYLMLSEVNS